jgi:hypothetical protein
MCFSVWRCQPDPPERAHDEERGMLWTILVIILVLWLLGFIGNIGPLIHLLLVVAAIVLLFQLLSGRRAV